MSRAVLDELLRHSFETYQVLFNKHQFHNHNAHHLGSLYLLGADEDKLKEVYKVLCDIVEPYEASPQPITRSNWRQFLGDKRFCQAYKDFFAQELLSAGENWQKKFIDLLSEEKDHPLINGIIFGLLHPLIHMGYAFELNSSIVAVEALTMTAVVYDELHHVVDQLPSPQSPSRSAWEIFQSIHLDEQLAMEEKSFGENLQFVLTNFNDRVLFYYHQWRMDAEHLGKVIEDLFDLSVHIYGATHPADQIQFDFFLLHLLTGMHAMRIIDPHINDRQVMKHLLHEFFYLAVLIYIGQGRRAIRKECIDDYPTKDIDNNNNNNWAYVIERTLHSDLCQLMHLVKVVYSLKAAEATYGTKNGLYLKTAIKTVDTVEFEQPWTGASDNPHHLSSLKHH